MFQQLINELPTSKKEILDRIDEFVTYKNRPARFFSIDLTNLSTAYYNKEHLERLKNAELKCIDSSWLPLILHNKQIAHSSLTDIFDILVLKKDLKQLVLGGPLKKLRLFSNKFPHIDFFELPFVDLNDFNYSEIAAEINQNRYDIIWVSLGAPKQELFIDKLYPRINRGVLCGFGYILDINSVSRRAPRVIQMFKLEWLYRFIQSPRKQGKRIRQILKFLVSYRLNLKKELIIQPNKRNAD